MGSLCLVTVVGHTFDRKPSFFKAGEDVSPAFEMSTFKTIEKHLHHYSSQPFFKPDMSLGIFQDNTDPKEAIREVAVAVNRTVKDEESLLPSVLIDHWSIADCQDAILGWAADLQ